MIKVAPFSFRIVIHIDRASDNHRDDRQATKKACHCGTCSHSEKILVKICTPLKVIQLIDGFGADQSLDRCDQCNGYHYQPKLEHMNFGKVWKDDAASYVIRTLDEIFGGDVKGITKNHLFRITHRIDNENCWNDDH